MMNIGLISMRDKILYCKIIFMEEKINIFQYKNILKRLIKSDINYASRDCHIYISFTFTDDFCRKVLNKTNMPPEILRFNNR